MLTCNYSLGRSAAVKAVLVNQMFPAPPSHPLVPAVREQPMPKPLKPLAVSRLDGCWEQLLAHAHFQMCPGIV